MWEKRLSRVLWTLIYFENEKKDPRTIGRFMEAGDMV